MEEHPYAAAGIVAGLLFLIYWFFTRNADQTVGQPVETTSNPSTAPFAPSGSPNYGTNLTADIAAQRQQAITDLNNQVMAARENLKSSLQSSAVRSGAGMDQNILNTIGKIAQGLFDKKIDTRLRNDLASGALPAALLAGGSPKGMAAGVLDEFFAAKDASLITGALPQDLGVPSTLTPFATNGPSIGINNTSGGGYPPTPYLGGYNYDAAPGYDWNDYAETPYNYDPYTEVYQPNYPEYTPTTPTTPTFDYKDYDFSYDWGGGAYSDNGYW